MGTDANNLLRTIRFTPSFSILLTCIFIMSIIYIEQGQEFIKEKQFIETEYIENEKTRINENINTIYNYIRNQKLESEKLLKKDLKNKIDIAYKIATNIYNKNKKTLSKNEIINQIKNALESIRFYEGRGYFSIHTIEGINISHPINNKFEHTSVLNRMDSRGEFPVKDVINIAKIKGEGFSTWYYFKPNDKSKEFKKIGIVKKFEPYNLIITTAEYTENFEKDLKKKILNHISKLKYKDEGFAFIIDYEGNILLHKSKDVLNHNLFEDKKFSHVSAFFKKLILDENKEIGDFISTIPIITLGEDTKEVKITYAKKFDDWTWIIATSFKLSDSSKLIEKRKILLEQKYDNYKKEVLIYGSIITLILLILSSFIAKLIENQFLTYQEKLEEHKNRLFQAQEMAHVGDWYYDITTQKSYLSEEILKIFGISKIEKNLMFEYIKKVIHPEDLEHMLNSFENTIKTGEDYFSIYRIYRPDNEIRWLSNKGSLNKEKNRIIGISQDITEFKLLEQAKLQNEELIYQQSKMAAMGEMLGNIAHQWRQPLSAISTAATGVKLQKEMDVLSDDDFNYSMDLINKSAQYLSATIDDFRSFFDPKNNKEKEFLLSNTIDKALNIVSSQFVAKDIEIIKNIEEISLISLENELIQVLLNMLNNSKDALLKLENEKRLIFINAYIKEKVIVIEIKDNAKGIKEEIIEKVFEPYFTTKHQSQGTGIGLYMCQDIVKNHLNASLSVCNEDYIYEGISYTGARFTIKISS